MVMNARRAILLNEPEIKTVTGATGVNFSADRVADIQSCKISLTATQSGSGTPSPSNIRSISYFQDFSVFHSDGVNQNEYTFNWLGGRSLGDFNLTTGLIWSTGYAVSFDGSSGWNAVGNKFYHVLADENFQKSTSNDAQICNMYPFAEIIESGSVSVTQNKHFYLQRVSSTLSYCRLWVYDTDYTLDQFKAMLNETPIVVTYPVKPFGVRVEKTPMKAFRGQNLIWNSNGTETTVEYLSH